MITTPDQERRIRDRAVELDSMTTEVKPLGPAGAGAALVHYRDLEGREIAVERVLPDGTATDPDAWLEERPAAMSDHQHRCLQLLLNGDLAAVDGAEIEAPAEAGEDLVVRAGERELRIPPEPRPDPMLDQAQRMPYARMWGILYGDVLEMETQATIQDPDTGRDAYTHVRSRMDALAGEAMLTGDPQATPEGDGPPVCICGELHRVGGHQMPDCPVHPRGGR